MDITGLSMNLAMVQTKDAVSTAMLAKAMDIGEIKGQGLVEMIEAVDVSAMTGIGQNFDVQI